MSHDSSAPQRSDEQRSGTAEPRRDYVVVARRYRPQSFEELVGQQHVGQALAGAINSGRIGHAYLFTGARGVGKTSSARIFAKALNCVLGPTDRPCNQCELCLGISSGDDVDVLEIDGASNRGIDEIRELRHNVHVRPVRARYKIYIIDEVHMLTREAFNALLKTLEEPPEHVKFIFCTTEPEKIPVTILSRCQRFDFAGIQSSEIADRLRFIAGQEGVEIDDEAVELLARRAGGSMRDSQSLLEQLLAFGGQRIAAADVHRLLGTAGQQRLSRLLQTLAEHDAAAALVELDAAVAEGVDVGQLLGQLLTSLRDLLVLAVGGSPDLLLHLPAVQTAELRQQAEAFGAETLLAMMQIVDQTLARLRTSTHGRVLAELALVRLARLDRLEDLAALLEALQGAPGEGAPSGQSGKKNVETGPRGTATLGATTLGAAAAGLRSPVAADSPAPRADETEQPSPTSAKPLPDDPRVLWEQVVEQVGTVLAEAAGCCAWVRYAGGEGAADAQATSAPNQLVVGFAANYNLARKSCESPDSIAKFEQALRRIVGRRMRVVIAQDVSAKEDNEMASRPVASLRQRLAEAGQHELIRLAGELFDARPTAVSHPENDSGR